MGCSSLSRPSLDGCSEGRRTPLLERATAFCARSAPPGVAAGVLADLGAGVSAVLRLAAGVIRMCSWRARSSLRGKGIDSKVVGRVVIRKESLGRCNATVSIVRAPSLRP
jgi:hypothetical protein